jgi:hypothetical protein
MLLLVLPPRLCPLDAPRFLQRRLHASRSPNRAVALHPSPYAIIAQLCCSSSSSSFVLASPESLAGSGMIPKCSRTCGPVRVHCSRSVVEVTTVCPSPCVYLAMRNGEPASLPSTTPLVPHHSPSHHARQHPHRRLSASPRPRCSPVRRCVP